MCYWPTVVKATVADTMSARVAGAREVCLRAVSAYSNLDILNTVAMMGQYPVRTLEEST